MQHPDLYGLTQEDAARQLLADGPNALPGSEPKSLLRKPTGYLHERGTSEVLGQCLRETLPWHPWRPKRVLR
jgi:Cation transporter/ATPase, N-terminus